MPAFTSERSIRVRSELCDPLQFVVDLAIAKIDFSLISGKRFLEQQQQLFRDGATTMDGVTKKSYHQGRNELGEFDDEGPSWAFDYIPVPMTTWEDRPLFSSYSHFFIGIGHAHGIELRSGIDWDGDFRWRDQSFHDFPHIQMVKWPSHWPLP